MTAEPDDFNRVLIKNLLSEAGNFWPDAELYRGAKLSFYKKFKNRVYQFVHAYFKHSLFTFDYQWSKQSVYFNNYQNLYSTLGDKESRSLLIVLITYFLFGCERVRFQTVPIYQRVMKEIENLKQSGDWIPAVIWPDNRLYKFSMEHFNLNLSFYSHAHGIFCLFAAKQYNYESPGHHCRVEPGDYVIDGGGCWGDSALYFAHLAGEKGKVYCFEFVPSSVDVIKKNIQLNSHLKDRIEIVAHPLWSISQKTMYHNNKGSSTRVSDSPFEGHTGRTETLSIDDFVESRQIPRVDFIKMDVEGAESEALKGAIRTIQRFRPKLAISVYHKAEDLFTIPEQIAAMYPDYEFFLGHYTPWYEEVIIYAKPRQ